jgi:hypothetical protein
LCAQLTPNWQHPQLSTHHFRSTLMARHCHLHTSLNHDQLHTFVNRQSHPCNLQVSCVLHSCQYKPGAFWHWKLFNVVNVACFRTGELSVPAASDGRLLATSVWYRMYFAQHNSLAPHPATITVWLFVICLLYCADTGGRHIGRMYSLYCTGVASSSSAAIYIIHVFKHFDCSTNIMWHFWSGSILLVQWMIDDTANTIDRLHE